MEYLVNINDLSANFEILLEKKNIIIKSQILFNDSSLGQLKPNDTLFFIESENDKVIKAKAIVYHLHEIKSRNVKIVLVFLKSLKKLKHFSLTDKIKQIVPDELVVEKIEAIKII